MTPVKQRTMPNASTTPDRNMDGRVCLSSALVNGSANAYGMKKIVRPRRSVEDESFSHALSPPRRAAAPRDSQSASEAPTVKRKG